jgi:hypothetical protein
VATFRDDREREWTVRLDHALLLRIRKVLAVDLHNMTEQAKALARMAEEPELLVNVLYLACEEQCKARDLSDEDFGRGFAEGETFERACLAFQEALLSFTPPQRRQIVKQTMTTTLGVRQRAEEMVANLVTRAINEATATSGA